MKNTGSTIVAMTLACIATVRADDREPVEISDDSREIIVIAESRSATDNSVTLQGSGVRYGLTPDWQNTVRRQVGGLAVADMNGDGWADVVVGCYTSQSFPPYEDWENLIYYNTGNQLESNASWVSTDEVSTGDIKVADINGDTYPDVFAANGGFAMSRSVIYWGTPTGPATTPTWHSSEPGLAWNNHAVLFDFDHDGDVDVFTANQGNSPNDPFRPIYAFINDDGTLPTFPSWQSAEISIQGFLAFGDLDGDGWEDLAVSKWANFQSGIYKNAAGSLQTTPIWTTGDTDTDKGVAWADVDGNGRPDLALGHDPTLLYSNNDGVLSHTWSSGAPFFGHADITFEDVDRDGDQDLAETHFSDGRVHIYLNRDGVLDTIPTWTYDSSSVGTAIAFGDINGDNWPDLIVGNSGEPCVKVFYANAPAPGDLNDDGTVNLNDYELFTQCAAGPGISNPGCDPLAFATADQDADGDVDFADFGHFQSLFTGGP